MVRAFSEHPKSELTRFHKMAERQGFVLEKSRKRDRDARLYNRYWLYKLETRTDKYGTKQFTIWRYGDRLGFAGLKGVYPAFDVPTVEQFLKLGVRRQNDYCSVYERTNFRTKHWDTTLSKLRKIETP
jgi:hypothetical protein